MSLCFLTPMSHQWHRTQKSLETLSSVNAQALNHPPDLSYASNPPNINNPICGLPETMKWPSISSSREKHNNPGTVVESHAMKPHVELEALAEHQYLQKAFEGTYETQCKEETNVAGEQTSIRTTTEEKSPAEDVDDDITTSDLGELAEDESCPQRAVERRAEKRKMRRFRLTHSQTRFLMAEFARQTHPDAAQRERLSREVPGLSSRQVQVWFQNRRAKLKRLPPSDRERMMRSRALPENFDRSTAFHSPLSPTPRINISTIVTPKNRPSEGIGPFGGFAHGHRRNLSGDTCINPAHGNATLANESTWGFRSVPASETQSPISPTGEMIHHSDSLFSRVLSPYSNTSCSRSRSFPNTHASPPYDQEPARRFRTGSLTSPMPTISSQIGNSRRRDSKLYCDAGGAPDLSLYVQHPSDAHFHGSVGYLSPKKDSYESLPQRSIESPDLLHAPRPMIYPHSLRLDTSIPTHGQLRSEEPPLQRDPSIHEIRSAPPITTPHYPWSSSQEQPTRHSSIAFPTPYPSELSYGTFEIATEDCIKAGATGDMANMPLQGLGLPQQVSD